MFFSLLRTKQEENNDETNENEYVINDAISPIKNVAPTEVEETFNAYFS